MPSEDEWKVLSIRTIDPDIDKFAETVGAGASYYKNLTGDTPIVFQSTETTEAGEPKVEVQDAASGKRLVVTYNQVEADAISGAVKYVDVDGNIIDTEIVENLGAGKEVAIKKSFFKTTTDEAGQETTHYYRVIQRLTGSTVMLTPEQATKQIRVMEVKNTKAGAYQVTINYVDDNGNTLWTDSVDVKGKGYQYTLPNSFSMSAVTNAADAPTTDRDKGQWGINYYMLDSWILETNATDDNAAIGARSTESQQGNPVVAFEAGEYPAGRTVTAKYVSQATTKKVNLTVMEINGETGALIDKIHYEVTPEQTATYTPAPKDGLVPWSGNMEPITYAWEDLEKGTDVLQYVYYVPKDYTPGDTYDITVQYMNIANSQILRSETITIDPETNDFVNILGEERFSLGDDTYVRLAGQETAIRHAYFSPARTYTIYYRDVNDELSSQITIRRTQIIDTERVVTVPGTTVMTAILGHMTDSADMLAAYTIMGNIDKFTTVSCFGLAGATAVILGKAIGEGTDKNHVYDLSWCLLLVSLFIGFTVAACLAILLPTVFIPYLYPLFHLEGLALEIAVTMCVVYLFMLPLKAFDITNITGLLRAGGDSRMASIIDLSCQWVIAVPLTFLTALVFNAPVAVVCLCIQSENVCKCPWGILRLRSRKWINDVTGEDT